MSIFDWLGGSDPGASTQVTPTLNYGNLLTNPGVGSGLGMLAGSMSAPRWSLDPGQLRSPLGMGLQGLLSGGNEAIKDQLYQQEAQRNLLANTMQIAQIRAMALRHPERFGQQSLAQLGIPPSQAPQQDASSAATAAGTAQAFSPASTGSGSKDMGPKEKPVSVDDLADQFNDLAFLNPNLPKEAIGKLIDMSPEGMRAASQRAGAIKQAETSNSKYEPVTMVGPGGSTVTLDANRHAGIAAALGVQGFTPQDQISPQAKAYQTYLGGEGVAPGAAPAAAPRTPVQARPLAAPDLPGPGPGGAPAGYNGETVDNGAWSDRSGRPMAPPAQAAPEALNGFSVSGLTPKKANEVLGEVAKKKYEQGTDMAPRTIRNPDGADLPPVQVPMTTEEFNNYQMSHKLPKSAASRVPSPTPQEEKAIEGDRKLVESGLEQNRAATQAINAIKQIRAVSQDQATGKFYEHLSDWANVAQEFGLPAPKSTDPNAAAVMIKNMNELVLARFQDAAKEGSGARMGQRVLQVVQQAKPTLETPGPGRDAVLNNMQTIFENQIKHNSDQANAFNANRNRGYGLANFEPTWQKNNALDTDKMATETQKVLGIAPDYKASPPSQADLEFTAKTHGITVDAVKRQLGIQ